MVHESFVVSVLQPASLFKDQMDHELTGKKDDEKEPVTRVPENVFRSSKSREVFPVQRS